MLVICPSLLILPTAEAAAVGGDAAAAAAEARPGLPGVPTLRGEVRAAGRGVRADKDGGGGGEAAGADGTPRGHLLLHHEGSDKDKGLAAAVV